MNEKGEEKAKRTSQPILIQRLALLRARGSGAGRSGGRRHSVVLSSGGEGRREEEAGAS